MAHKCGTNSGIIENIGQTGEKYTRDKPEYIK